jgi:hypothetical protein
MVLLVGIMMAGIVMAMILVVTVCFDAGCADGCAHEKELSAFYLAAGTTGR